MVAEAFAGLGAIKTAFDLARGLKDINDAAVRNSAIIELQEKILTAQQFQSELLDRVSHLERQIASFDTWEKETSRYKLRDFGGGTFAYELQQDRSEGEPIHRICPTCFGDHKKSILQPHGRNATHQELYSCQRCKSEFKFGHRQERVFSSRANTRYNPHEF